MSTINNERSSLKIKLIQDQLEILRKKMLSTMDIMCTISEDFTDLEEKIKKIQSSIGYKEPTIVEHPSVLDAELPDVGDNTSIAKAHATMDVSDNTDHDLMGSAYMEKESADASNDCDTSTFEYDMQAWLEGRKKANIGI
jgi:hypothetical protein